MSEDDEYVIDSGKKEKELMYKEYQRYYDAAVAKYGPLSAVFMQVGQWWRCYGVEQSNGDVSTNIKIIEVLTGSNKMQKDTVPVSPQLPSANKKSAKKGTKTLEAGTTMETLADGTTLRSIGQRYDQINERAEPLHRRGYHIVKYEQIQVSEKVFERRFLEVIPPGVPILESQDAAESNRICIYIANPTPAAAEPARVEIAPLIVGLSSVEVSTGHVSLHEVMPEASYGAKGLDEAYRFLQSGKPVKITRVFRGFSRWTPEKQLQLQRHIDSRLQIDSQPEGTQLNVRFVTNKDDDIWERASDVGYQHAVFKKVYKGVPKGQMEWLENTPFASTALTIELDELSICDVSILRRMRTPETWNSRKILVLQHNAIEQLDLAPPQSHVTNCGCGVNKRLALICKTKKRPDYLIDVVDKTSTKMGARLLLRWLKAPSNSADEIRARLDTVEAFVKLPGDARAAIQRSFRSIRMDIEKAVRLSQFSQFGPKHVADMAQTFDAVLVTMGQVLGVAPRWFARACPDYVPNYADKIRRFVELLKDTFELDHLTLLKFDSWKSDPDALRFFRAKKRPALDAMFQDIDTARQTLSECQQTMGKLLFPQFAKQPEELAKKVPIKVYAATGEVYFGVSKGNHPLMNHYLRQFAAGEAAQWFDDKKDFDERGGKTTKKKVVSATGRGRKKVTVVNETNSDEEQPETLADVQAEFAQLQTTFKAHLTQFSAPAPAAAAAAPAAKPAAPSKVVPKSISGMFKDAVFSSKAFGGSVQIKAASKTQNTINQVAEALFDAVKAEFERFVKTQIDPLYSMFDAVCDLVASVDVLFSHSLVSIAHNYHKPEVVSDAERPFIDATVMRHPVIERRLVDTEFVPNDVRIGLEHTGLLVYGVNNIGKTSYEKAVALNLILSQIGCYVPAQTWRFAPFDGIITRLSGQDNMRGGQGTFAVEMSELRTILNGNERTLAIGDEICHGTEPPSAISLVAASVVRLTEKRIPFLFATHLHHLAKMPEIRALETVRFVHFHAEYDPSTRDIVYHRTLKEGPGLDTYGIEVAKAQGIPEAVISAAHLFRREVLRQPDSLVSGRRSHFNSDHIMDQCELRGCDERRDLDTHHIRFQSEADEDGFIDGRFHMNSAFNLVTLCKAHHRNVHEGRYTIAGWALGADGERTLRYTENTADVKSIGYQECGDIVRPAAAVVKKIKQLQLVAAKAPKDHPNRAVSAAVATVSAAAAPKKEPTQQTLVFKPLKK